MAHALLSPSLRPRLARALRAALVRALGLVLLAAGLWGLVALLGFDAGDPSWNATGRGPVANPLGYAGAVFADLGLQLFGIAAGLLPLALLAWGTRLAFGTPWRQPAIPLTSLPLALIASAAALAALATPAAWPYRVGLGGLVGDLIYTRLVPALGQETYLSLTLPLALVLGVLALGPRVAEALWALGRLAAASRRAGRGAGRVAAATVRAGYAGLRRLRPPRPPAPRAATSASPSPAHTTPASSARLRRLGRALARLLQPSGPDVATAGVGRRPRATVEAVGEDAAPPTPPPSPLEGAAEPAADPAPRRPARRRRSRRETQTGGGDPLAAAEGEEGFRLPAPELLQPPPRATAPIDAATLEETGARLEQVLADFGVRGAIVDARPGPVVTRFELEPAPGTRAQRVISLADDIARSLSATSVRIATVPGRTVIGIEVPNPRRQLVSLRELLESAVWRDSRAPLPLALGKDIAGEPVVTDLARMPHLLIAGTTGSGKSVAINAMILSLLYRHPPARCRLILIDPKVIELSVYEDIPHLLAPVVTEPAKAVVALKWLVRQMDERYRLMSHLGVRDIFAFNRRIQQARARGERLTRRVRTGFDPATGAPVVEEQPLPMDPLPLIVVVVDEMADLMLTAGKEVEAAIQRLSQKARAAGIHLILATQRPSVDVITGVIKANLPSRISFRVSSKIDSRTILGEPGAEQLLGQGDMLFLTTGAQRPVRIHGPLVTEEEVERVVDHLRAQGEPDYLEEVTTEAGEDGSEGLELAAGDGRDGLYARAVQIVLRDRKASTSYLQRKLSIGYNNAARLIERMEAEGIVSAPDHVGRRRILRGADDASSAGDHM